MDKKWSDKFENVIKELEKIYLLTEKYGNAFNTIGNSTMSKNLFILSDKCGNIMSEIKEIKHGINDDEYMEASKASATILKTALAVNSLNKK